MKNELNSFEVQLTNRILQGGSLNESKSIQIAIRNFISDEKAQIMQELSLGEPEFRTFHLQTVNNILNFLKSNEFVAEREGGVVFITEKGKNLRRQGTIEKYESWAKETRAKNKTVLRTIETRGYLDQDEIIRNKRALIMKRIKKFVVYPLLLLILCFFLLLGAHHYNLDKDIPVIRNLFKKEEVEKSEIKEVKHPAKKHKKRK
jgi:hypothetical protein